MGTKCTREIQQYFTIKIGSLGMKSSEVANKTDQLDGKRRMS